MRIVRRLAHALILVLMLVVGATAAVIVVSQTSWFKNWLRGYIVREAGQYLNGTLSIDRLDGNLFFGIEMENVGLSMDGSEVIAIEDAGIDYSIFELISTGLSVDNIRLNKPIVYLRRDGETWSISRLIKKQEQEADRQGPARPVSIAEIDITDGLIVVDGPVGTTGVAVPKRFEHLDAKLAINYEPVRYSIEITQVSFRGSNPALAINALSGGVAVRDDTVFVEQLALRTPETSLLVDGAVQHYLTTPVFNMQVSSDKFSLPEVARLVPALARFRLQPAFELNLNGPLDRLSVDMNVRSSAGQLTGSIVADMTAPQQSAAGSVSVRRLDLAPILSDASQRSDITADVRLDVRGAPLSDLDSVRGTASVNASRIATAAFTADRVTGSARINGRRIAIDASGSAYGASATASGNVVLPAAENGPVAFDLRGRTRDVDLRRLPRELDIPPAATDVSGQYHVTGSMQSGGRRTVDGDVRFDPSTIAGASIAGGSTLALAIDGREVGYEADATLANLDLQRIGTEFRIAALATDRYSSSINGRMVASGRGTTRRDMAVTARGTLRDTAVFGGRIPQLTFDANLQQDTAQIQATGSFAGFDPAVASGKPAIKGTVGGMLDIDATVSNVSGEITPDSVQASGRIHLDPSTVGGLDITKGTIDGDYRSATADLRTLEIVGPDLNVQASGTVALNDTGQSNLMVHADSSNLERLGKLVEQPLAGIVGVDATLTGNRRELQATGTLTGGGVKYGNNGALAMSSAFTLKMPDLQLEKSAVSATTKGTFVTLFGQNINELTAQTDYSGNQLVFDASARQPQRTLDAGGSLVMHPDHREVHLQRLSLTTQGITWQTAAGSEATIQYGKDTVSVSDFTLVSGDQQISADGQFGHSSDSLDVVVSNVDVSIVDALLLRAPQLSGRLNAEGTITGSTDLPQVKADFTITDGGFRQFQYETFGGTANYTKQSIALDTTLQQNATTWIQAKGQVPTALFDERGATSTDPIDLRIDSTPMDAGLVQGFTTALTNVTGTIEAHVQVTGSAADPRASGAITIQHAAFTLEPNGVTYSALDGRIDLQPDRIHVDELRVLDNHQSPLTVKGDLAIRERKVGEMSIAVTAADFKVIDNEMGNVRLSTDLRLTGQLNAPRLEGELGVTTGEINLDSILNAFSPSAYATEPIEFTTNASGTPSAAAAPGTPSAPIAEAEGQKPAPAALGIPGMAGLLEAMRVDVQATVPNDLIVRARDLRAPGAPISLGELNVTLGGNVYVHQVPYDRIRLYGAINTVRGTYDFQGRQFTILRDGEVRFDGFDDFDPEIDLRAERVIQAVTARVDVLGTFKRPQIVLSSVPPLEQADILSLIVFNQPINQLGEGQQLSLAERAQALATGAVATQLANSVGKALNLDIFEISTAPDSGADAELTIGQQVGQNLFLKVQQGIGDQTQTNFILEYELADWLRLQTNVVEGSSTQQQLFQRMHGSGVDLLFFFSY